MATIPAKVAARITGAVPKFQKILEQARERDVNESDTVTIITDILEEVFGFDKYTEITREYSIQGTYCDLAIKTEKKIEYLIEVKAIGIELKEPHLKQAVNYASREGIRWVVLTNGISWQIHRVTLDTKVENEKLVEFDFTELKPRRSEDQETVFLLCKRGVQKELIEEFYEYRQSVNRYTIGAVMLTEPIVKSVRSQLRKVKEGLKVSNEEIEELLKNEVLKRDVIESDAALEAQKSVQKSLKKRERVSAKAKTKAPEPPRSQQSGSQIPAASGEGAAN